MSASEKLLDEYIRDRAQSRTPEQMIRIQAKNVENYFTHEVPSDLSMAFRIKGARMLGYMAAGAITTFGLADTSTVINCLTVIGLAGDDSARSVESLS